MNILSSNNPPADSKSMDPYKEKNKDPDTTLKEKVEDLSEFISACKFGMMTTRDASTGMLASRCMALAAKVHHSFVYFLVSLLHKIPPLTTRQETGGIDLLFHTNTHSGKASELESDSHINISFLNSSGEWASIAGSASILTDRETVKKHYSKGLKAWLGDLGDGTHDGGPDDPRIGVIRVRTKTATYALAKGTGVGRAMDVAKGAVMGSVPEVNKLREIGEDEVMTWRESQRLIGQGGDGVPLS